MTNIEILKSISVVYVEDDEAVRDSITMSLKRKVKIIHEAENGEEGIELIKKYNPEIVITDVEMPVMDGLTMIKKIRENEELSVPIIVITAYEDDEHFTALADGYIYKPVNLKALFELMKNLMESKKIK